MKANRKKVMGKNNTSGYRGVTWYKKGSKWQAQLRYRYRTIVIGRFDNKHDAAKAYDDKARELWGEETAVNFGG